MAKKNISVYLSFLLRHRPETIHLSMDKHGWVLVEDLIEGVNKGGRYQLDLGKLEAIVAQDSKGRYRFNADHSKIKACQGHSIPWVEPELEYLIPPDFLYHGTTTAAVEKIRKSGAISIIATLGNYVVSVYGDEELVNTFRDKLQAAYSDAAIAYDEMIGEGEFSDGEDTALEAPVA